MAQRMACLEALRGIAALFVVLFHLQDIVVRNGGAPPLYGAFGGGDRGVDLFFVLSGFIILWSHRRDIGRPAQIAPYLVKRACRLFPGVWITTALAALIYSLQFGGPDKAFKLQAWNVVASAALLPQRYSPLVNVTWTLTYEVLFYALFAALIVNRRLGLALMLAWQAGIVLVMTGLFTPDHWLAAYYLRPICLEFGIGMLCAHMAGRGTAWLADRRAVLALLAVGAATVFGGMVTEGLAGHRLTEGERWWLYGLGSGALILGCAALERRSPVRLPRPLQWLGAASYSIYLTNFSVMTAVWLIIAKVRPGLWEPLPQTACIGLALLSGGMFHALIDRPIQTALKKIAPGLPRQQPARRMGETHHRAR